MASRRPLKLLSVRATLAGVVHRPVVAFRERSRPSLARSTIDIPVDRRPELRTSGRYATKEKG
jgi:hypothetical protein